MKKFSILLFLVFLLANIYAGPAYLGKHYGHVSEPFPVCIYEDNIQFEKRNELGKLEQSNKFDFFKGETINYVILNCFLYGVDFLSLIKQDNTSKYTYGAWEIPLARSDNESWYDGPALQPFSVIKADSYITEKGKDGKEVAFIPEQNKLFGLISNPWAVTKDAKKVIYLGTEEWRHPDYKYVPISEMIFVNGFVHPGKEYLYEQNARAKTIRISYDGTIFDTELKDEGNFQLVHLPSPIDPRAKNSISIEILDSYPGTKYSDIVISGVYYFDGRFKEER